MTTVLSITAQEAFDFVNGDYISQQLREKGVSLKDFYSYEYDGRVLEIIASLHQSANIRCNEIEDERSMEAILRSGEAEAIEDYTGGILLVCDFDRLDFLQLIDYQDTKNGTEDYLGSLI
ncbi:TPA: hypothetical protein ACQ2HY_003302 [Klebsiella pneumoniae]